MRKMRERKEKRGKFDAKIGGRLVNEVTLGKLGEEGGLWGCFGTKDAETKKI